MEYGVLIIWAHWVTPRGVVKLLASWPSKFNRHRTTVIWSMIPYCLMWGIWGERNTHTFEGNERSIHHLKILFFQTLFEWATASGVPTFTSLHDLYLIFSHLFFNEVIYLLKFKKKKKIMNQSQLNLKTVLSIIINFLKH